MKISLSQTDLQHALSVVIKGVSSRSTLPILSGIYISTQEDTIVFQSSDLEKSIKYSCVGLVEEQGEIVIPGKLFFDISKSLPDAAVTLISQNGSVSITCEASSFSLKSLDPQEFPTFPEVEAHQQISIPFSHFSSMIKKVARAVSRDETRMIFTGILISCEENHLKFVATDSYRLAMVETDIENNNLSFEAVISGSFLSEIAALPKTNEQIILSLSENQVIIEYQNTVFINRRIEGSFPNYKQLLPESYEMKASINTENFMAAVRRISLIDTLSTPLRLDFNSETQTVQLSLVAQGVGSAQEILSCEITGESNEIAFNYAYVLDGLSVISQETIDIEIINATKPGILKTSDNEDFLYLIMPVRVS